MPVLMLGPNDRLGRPRVEELRDFIGTVGAGVEGDSATRFRALLRRHSIAVPQTFHLATPTFYGSSGRSRIDFVATHPSVQFSRIFVNFTADRRLQLILAAGPRDQLAMDLVTSGMRHCPDLTRGRWDHEKIEEMLWDPVARLTFFKELETKIRNSSIVGCAATGHRMFTFVHCALLQQTFFQNIVCEECDPTRALIVLIRAASKNATILFGDRSLPRVDRTLSISRSLG